MGIWIAICQGCTTQILWQAKIIFFETLRAETTMFLTCSIGVSIKQTSKKQESVCFAGHIKSFRGPYVVHACYMLKHTRTKIQSKQLLIAGIKQKKF